MKFVSVLDLRGESSDVWEQLSDEREVVVTSEGRPIALLSSVTEDTLEESLAAVRRARAVAAVAEIQRRSAETGLDLMTLDEINAEIAAARREYKQQKPE